MTRTTPAIAHGIAAARVAILLVILLSLPLPAIAQKAGVGAWENSRYTMLGWLERTPNLGWYYNWRPDQMHTRGGTRRSVEFVPMIHGRSDVDKRIESDIPLSALLGFNEPDGAVGDHQADISVEEAIRLWPRLEKRGLRLGSPATTQAQTLGAGSWQRRFMTAAKEENLRVDFMAVHYYSRSGDVSEFRDWLMRVHSEYQRPIWVTEFAYIDWSRPDQASYAQNARFLLEATEMMEKLDFVERHAWFAANPYPWGETTPHINLLSDTLKPTPIGVAFERARGASGPG